MVEENLPGFLLSLLLDQGAMYYRIMLGMYGLLPLAPVSLKSGL
jgi:hypothetical protein